MDFGKKRSEWAMPALPLITSCAASRKSFNFFWPSFSLIWKLGIISIYHRLPWKSNVCKEHSTVPWTKGIFPTWLAIIILITIYEVKWLNDWDFLRPGEICHELAELAYCLEMFLSLVLETCMWEQSLLPPLVHPSLRMYTQHWMPSCNSFSTPQPEGSF